MRFKVGTQIDHHKC